MITILRVEVSNSKFLGPFTIETNTQYNAFHWRTGDSKVEPSSSTFDGLAISRLLL